MLFKARFGDEALRYAAVSVVGFYLLAALLMMFAVKRLQRRLGRGTCRLTPDRAHLSRSDERPTGTRPSSEPLIGPRRRFSMTKWILAAGAAALALTAPRSPAPTRAMAAARAVPRPNAAAAARRPSGGGGQQGRARQRPQASAAIAASRPSADARRSRQAARKAERQARASTAATSKARQGRAPRQRPRAFADAQGR